MCWIARWCGWTALVGSFAAFGTAHGQVGGRDDDVAWRSVGYGYAISISGESLNAYEVTEVSCLPGFGAHRMPDGSREVMPFVDARGMAAATGITSTVEDMAKFVSAQFRNGPRGGGQMCDRGHLESYGAGILKGCSAKTERQYPAKAAFSGADPSARVYTSIDIYWLDRLFRPVTERQFISNS